MSGSAAQAEATLSIEVTCHHCQRHPNPIAVMDVFLEMAPGMDGLPWTLCVKCWLAYLRNEGSLASRDVRVLEVPKQMEPPPPGPRIPRKRKVCSAP